MAQELQQIGPTGDWTAADGGATSASPYGLGVGAGACRPLAVVKLFNVSGGKQPLSGQWKRRLTTAGGSSA